VQTGTGLVRLSHLPRAGLFAEWGDRLNPGACRRPVVQRPHLEPPRMKNVRSVLFSVAILASFLLTLAAPFRWW
jgi:hypothetical protein